MNTTISEKNLRLWALGLIEAEGYIGFNTLAKEGPKSKNWIFAVKVSMKNTNRRAIHKIKSIMKVGKVREDSLGMITWKVTDRKKIKEFILPVFDIYPPRGVKYHEYDIFKQGLAIVENPSLTTDEKHQKLILLKKQSKIIREVSPVVSNNPAHWQMTAQEVITFLDKEKLKELYDPWWIAGFVEGDGSLQINNKLQIVFELAQMHDKMAIYAIHKILNSPALVIERASDGYTKLSTKNQQVIKDIMNILNGKILGIKSFEYKLWCYAYNTKLITKKQKARDILARIRNRYVKPGDME